MPFPENPDGTQCRGSELERASAVITCEDGRRCHLECHLQSIGRGCPGRCPGKDVKVTSELSRERVTDGRCLWVRAGRGAASSFPITAKPPAVQIRNHSRRGRGLGRGRGLQQGLLSPWPSAVPDPTPTTSPARDLGAGSLPPGPGSALFLCPHQAWRSKGQTRAHSLLGAQPGSLPGSSGAGTPLRRGLGPVPMLLSSEEWFGENRC